MVRWKSQRPWRFSLFATPAITQQGKRAARASATNPLLTHNGDICKQISKFYNLVKQLGSTLDIVTNSYTGEGFISYRYETPFNQKIIKEIYRALKFSA